MCFNTQLSISRTRAGITSCAECDDRTPTRIEKIVVPLLLAQIDHPPSAQDDVLFGGVGCDAGRRRPDLAWFGRDRVIKVGIDEHSHDDRTVSCEMGKMHDQFVSWQKLLGCAVPVFYLKLNPDAYDGPNTRLDTRLSIVANRVNELLTMDDISAFTTLVPHVEYFYYHSKAAFHIDAVRNAVDSFVLIG